MRTVLIVEDERSMRLTLSAMFNQEGFTVSEAERTGEAVEKVKRQVYDAAIIDLRIGEEDGIDVLKAVKKFSPGTEAIVITGHGSIESAVEAMKLGASNYLTTPFNLDELVRTIRAATQKKTSQIKLRDLRNEIQEGRRPSDLVVLGHKMHRLLDMALRVARTDATVLIQGESGTGKEVLARAIHRRSPRAGHSFIAIDCATLPEPLLESELFGHTKGAFTGALATKKGLFEEGDGGTIFLDDLEAMPLSTQVKLLRVLQDRAIRRVGGTTPIQIDIRILAANRELTPLVEQGAFREDLYYRINGIVLTIPPLRERGEDIIALANYFLKHYGSRVGRAVRGISAGAMQLLIRYPWPGNVRELEKVIERALVFGRSDLIIPEDLPPRLLGLHALHPVPPTTNKGLTLADLEKAHILAALHEHNRNKARAAEALGIDRATLWRKLKVFDISDPG